MGYQFDWVDAFTSVPFGGNGCVVVHDAAALTVNQRLALVRETSLSECAYIVPSDKADFGVRYYLTDREIPLAGHPTIATVTSLLDRGMVVLQDGSAAFTLEVGAGVMPIEVSGDMITMTQPAPVFGPVADKAEIAAMSGLSAEDIIAPPQIVSTGSPFCITLLRDKEALKRVTLDDAALLAFRANSRFENAGVMEPFFVTLGGETSEGDVFSRLLLPAPMPPEDPFTGSATGCMGAYLWHHGLINAPIFTAEQGHWLGRPGMAAVEVLGPREVPTGVKVGGTGRVIMRGELDI